MSSALTNDLRNEEKLVKIVGDYDRNGKGHLIPRHIRKRFQTIQKSTPKSNNEGRLGDDSLENKMKVIEKITKQNLTLYRKTNNNKSTKGGKTKRKRRSNYKKKKKN